MVKEALEEAVKIDNPFKGQCPVCGLNGEAKDMHTGAAKAPVPGLGRRSCYICAGCGTVLEYVGHGEWIVALDQSK